MISLEWRYNKISDDHSDNDDDSDDVSDFTWIIVLCIINNVQQ